MTNPQLLTETRDEVTNLLGDLIRINTTNPPGNETEAAKFLVRTLEKEGLECELLESCPGRGNVITRIRGSGTKPCLLLLSHLDVVGANARDWSVDPFAGEVKGGFVWGRGALDMKSMAAIEVMTLKLLKRRGLELKGDVILAATADEEKGGEAGVGWLCRNYPEKIRSEYVISEMGGLAVPVNDKNVYTVQTAEKGILWLKLRAKGTAGHGSMPGVADNPILLMNDVVGKLSSYRPEVVVLPIVREYLAELAREPETAWHGLAKLMKDPALADQILGELAEIDKVLVEEIRAKLSMTMTPTMIHGGSKENVIPSECEAVFDCRVLPGQTVKEAIDVISNLVKESDLRKLDFEVIQATEPSESPSHTALYEQIVSVLKDFDKGCSVVPDMLTGGTDCHFLRPMGAVCYGFQPMRADTSYGDVRKRFHGVDERISVDNLVFGTSVLYAVVERFMT